MSRNTRRRILLSYKNGAHTGISIVVLSDIEQRSILRGEITKLQKIRSYSPLIMFARGLFQPRLIIKFSSNSNIH